MQKNKITLIIVLMSLALLGIIFLQINWIRHDFIIKEQQFDQQVSEAMNAVVDKLETRQALNFIGTSFFRYDSDTNFWRSLDKAVHPGHPPPPGSLFPPKPQNRTELPDSSFFKTMLDIRKELKGAFERAPDGNDIEISDSSFTGDTWRKEQFNIKTDSLRMMTEIKHLKINQELLKDQKMHVQNDMMHAEIEKQQIRTDQELVKMKIKVNSKMQKLNEVMNMIAMEYVKEDENALKVISPDQLDTLLNKELQNCGVTTSYNFGLLNSDNDTIIDCCNRYIHDPAQKAALTNTKYRVNLFPNDLISNGEYLLLHFPSRITYVLTSMLWMLIGSVLFTVTIILVFAYTINMLVRQKKLSEIKSDFISNMTHEFKTPIATIALAVDAINNPKVHDDREKVQYYSNIIREENKRMNKQVETILQTALFEKKDFKINKTEIDIHNLIEKAVENIRLQVEAKQGTIQCHLNSKNNILQGDHILLTTAIVNLLDNANKYSPANPEIKVTTENREKGILISVEDKGMGMSKETMSNVFEKFYRQQTGNVHDVKGFGLGLSHVKTIVAEHGGEIKVTSEDGKGSRFDVYLPLG